jgi:hypothetical protein
MILPSDELAAETRVPVWESVAASAALSPASNTTAATAKMIGKILFTTPFLSF